MMQEANRSLQSLFDFSHAEAKKEIESLVENNMAKPIKELAYNVQKPIIDLVNKILYITKDDDYLQNPQKRARVKDLEREIDQLVYQIYGLTEEEIKIVEGAEK